MKKLLSIILVAAMLFTAAVPAFAQQTADSSADAAPVQTAQESSLPFVLVRGMDFGGLYLDYGTREQRKAMGDVSAGSVVKTLFKALTAAAFRGESGFVQVLLDFVNELLGSYACNEQGKPAYNVSTPSYPESVDHYEGFNDGIPNEFGIIHKSIDVFGAGNTYYFNYDWRLNPLDIADDINELINTALAESGKDKVNLACASMGGVMTVAYLTKYGYDKINKCVFLSSTFCGTYVTTDLLQGKISIGENELRGFCKNLGKDNAALKTLINVLDRLGAFSRVSDFLAKFVERNKAVVYEQVLKPIFGRDLSVWSLVQPSEVDKCVEYMFGSERDKYASLISDIYDLRAMMLERDDLILRASAEGCEIAVVATYDSPLIPVYEHAYVNGDATLETHYMSGYATVADYGKTLGDSYVPRTPGYLSPDRVIDASTCLLPDYTWMIKGAPHVSCSYGSDYSEFVFWILTYDGRASISSSDSYPQFMLSGSDQSLKRF